jgi:hypothetical protein
MPTKINRAALERAIANAVAVFTNDPTAPDDAVSTEFAPTEALAAEITLGMSRLPGKPLVQDLRAYVLALLAVKAICGGAMTDREGILRCLYGAASEMRRYRLALVPASARGTYRVREWPYS